MIWMFMQATKNLDEGKLKEKRKILGLTESIMLAYAAVFGDSK